MPVKSKAQLAKFQELHEQGKISAEMFAKWTRDVDASALPERLRKKKPKKVTR